MTRTKMSVQKELNEKRDRAVDHPDHYGGKDNPYEVIKIIEAWSLGFALGNAVKYLLRSGRKVGTLDNELQDLEKARWYIDRHITNIRGDIERARDVK